MASKRILVVEDDAAIRASLQQWLLQAGYDTDAVASAEEGLARLQHTPFDLLLADLALPSMSGSELVANAVEHDPQLAAIVITSYGSVENILAAVHAGAQAVIPKPVAQDEFIRTVQDTLRRQLHHHEAARQQVLSPLLELGQLLAEATSVGQATLALLHAITRATPAKHLALLLADHATGRFTLAEARGSLLASTEQLAAGLEQVRRLVEPSSRPLELMDAQGDLGATLPALRRQGLSSVICLPLRARGRLLGALLVGRPSDDGPFAPSEIHLLSSMCGQLAMALEGIFSRAATPR